MVNHLIFSDMSINFYGSHIINCAENGGALLNDQAAISKAKLLRSWGRVLII